MVKLKQKNSRAVVEKTSAILNRGGLVISPSDTVYGLLVRADSEQAIRKLINFKNRPPGKPISIFLRSIKEISRYAFVTEKKYRLIKTILPGRYTVVLNSRHKLSSLLEAEKGTLGVRVIKNLFINSLLSRSYYPLTATSANLSNRPPVHSISSFLGKISKEKKQLIDLVVDGGRLPRYKPSTVIDLSGGKIKTLRKGDKIFPEKKRPVTFSEEETKKIALNLLADIKDEFNKRAVVILLRGPLGVGKTVFVKAIGAALKIERIVSPTFVIYWEYPVINKVIKKLYHFDLYRLNEEEELTRLRMDRLFKKGNLICIEWGEKIAAMINRLEEKVFLIDIEMRYLNENKRRIIISYQSN